MPSIEHLMSTEVAGVKSVTVTVVAKMGMTIDEALAFETFLGKPTSYCGISPVVLLIGTLR